MPIDSAELRHGLLPQAEDFSVDEKVKNCLGFVHPYEEIRSLEIERFDSHAESRGCNAQPLRDRLGEAAEVLDPFDFHELRANRWVTIHAPVNWKVAMEVFHEGYHP
jgi:hypothetical protein